MKRFRVLMNGSNFLLLLDGKVRRVGFFVTRFVLAPDHEQAELAAVEMLQADSVLRRARNARDDPPVLYVEEVEEAYGIQEQNGTQPGFAFYDDEEDSFND